MFHPRDGQAGNLVLHRRRQKSYVQTQISTIDLAKISRQACGLEEIYFSTAAFSGQPLLLNFSHSNCLHLQVPKVEWNTYILLTLRLENKGIPLPTATVFDGEKYTLLWILETPIKNHEFYIYTLLQQALHEAAIGFNPEKCNLDIAFLVRMVGSVNRNTRKHVGLVNDYGKVYSRSYLEGAILKSKQLTAIEVLNLQTQAGITLELMSLIGDRWFSTAQNPELFYDWLIFFGSSLCNFCTPEQLFKELCAIAESLEANQWKKICEKYLVLIKSIIETARLGYINFEGIHLSINEPNWRDMIKGKLAITSAEQEHLGLQVLGNQSSISPHLHRINKSVHPIGTTEFVPLGRFLLQKV
ncbi:hypothetical protein CBR65_01285 [Cellvibrio sp. PSBB006]|nr:hypothetical protein CBR65_01285 [Cellvibrio sp. PSBB006]